VEASHSYAPRMDTRVCNAMDKLCRLALRAFARADHSVSNKKRHVSPVTCAFDTRTTSSTNEQWMQMDGMRCRRTATDERACDLYLREVMIRVRGGQAVHAPSSDVVGACLSTSFSLAHRLDLPDAPSPRPTGCKTSSKARLASDVHAARRLRRLPRAAIA